MMLMHSWYLTPDPPRPCCTCTSVDNLLVKYVLFNNTSYDWWASPNALNSSKWVSIAVHSTLTDLSPVTPIDLVITVRGAVDQLCPAVGFMQTQDVCEYALHGRDGDYQCCPHGVTPPQGPPEQCCVDDLPKSPYRLDFARALRSAASPAVQQGAGGDQSVTDLTFVVQVRKQTGGGGLRAGHGAGSGTKRGKVLQRLAL